MWTGFCKEVNHIQPMPSLAFTNCQDKGQNPEYGTCAGLTKRCSIATDSFSSIDTALKRYCLQSPKLPAWHPKLHFLSSLHRSCGHAQVVADSFVRTLGGDAWQTLEGARGLSSSTRNTVLVYRLIQVEGTEQKIRLYLWHAVWWRSPNAGIKRMARKSPSHNWFFLKTLW